MIRINLIKTEKKKRGKSGVGFASQVNIVELVVIGLLISMGFVGVYIVYNIQEDKLAEARNYVKREKRAIKGLAQAKKRLEEFKKKKKLLKAQLDVIDKLRRQKQGPVRVLDEISMRVPKQVWLVNIRQKNASLTIKGEAETNESVAIFFKRLQDSPYFKKVELQQIVRRSVANTGGDNKRVNRTVFSLSCVAVFSTGS